MNPDSSDIGIPRILWMMWLQGRENAPEVVQGCLPTWAKHNPGWKIVFLHQHNLKEYLDVDEVIGRNREHISIQALSNVIRINLLALYGGLWVDSTCFCCKPLDEWLGDYTRSGFFAFANPGRDRLLSSWFLASHPGCPLTTAWCREVNGYWTRNAFPFQDRQLGRLALRWTGKLLNHNSWLAALWVQPQFARIFRLHPYHWFHYIFYRVVAADERCGQIWSRTPKITADGPHRLQQAGLLSPLSTGLKAIIDEQRDPLYKLNWRYRRKDWRPDSVLDYLMQSQAVTV